MHCCFQLFCGICGEGGDLVMCEMPDCGRYFVVIWSVSTNLNIDPEMEILCTQNCNYFLTHGFKQVFWVLKRTVSLRRFF